MSCYMRDEESGWIVTLPAKGMATQNALERAPRPAEGAVLLDRVDGVLAAAWLVAAMSPHNRPQRDAVEQHELDEEPLHDVASIELGVRRSSLV